MSETSIHIDTIKVFQVLYKQFQDKQNIALELAIPKKTSDETPLQFMLRLADWYDTGKHSDLVHRAFEDARRAGRDCLSFVLHHHNYINCVDFIIQHKQYLLSQGCAELINICLFIAPLDTLEWRFMKIPQTDDDEHFGDGRYATALSEMANNIHGIYITDYMRSWNATHIDDPFPSDVNTDIETATPLFLSFSEHYKEC